MSSDKDVSAVKTNDGFNDTLSVEDKTEKTSKDNSNSDGMSSYAAASAAANPVTDAAVESGMSGLATDPNLEQSQDTADTTAEPHQSELSVIGVSVSDASQNNTVANGIDIPAIPKNFGPVFNSPMDSSEIKNVTHNNSSELSLLISALEEQQKRTVTTLRTDNSEYTRKLDEIFNPSHPTSEYIPQKENLNTSNLFNEKFKNASSVIDSKLDIVLDAEKYLNELKESVIRLTSEGGRQVSSDVSRSIEGISSIVADLTSTKSSSSDLKSALSKLPSFDESGNIVSAQPVVNKAEDTDDAPFELTPQSEELSVDEAFAQAQKEALAQLEQDKELENQLKEDAQRLNQSLRDSSINLEAVINPQTTPQEKSDILADEDAHYIQNIDDIDGGETASSDNSEAIAKASISAADSETPKENAVAVNKSGVEVTYVAGYFEGKTKEVTEIIPDKLESLSSVLSEFELNTSELSEHKQNFDEVLSSAPVLPPSLQQAVDSALCGNYGQNVNAASENSVKDKPVLSVSSSADLTEELLPSVSEADAAYAVENAAQGMDSGFTPVVDDDDSDDDSHIEAVRVSDLKAVDNSNTSESENNLIDGNPKIVRESTLKLIEAERQFENRRLGRKLEPKDFYYKVEQTDPWFQTILKSGYNDGPVFSALCYSKRIIDPNNQYKWKLQISTDFELMTSAPDFHHNLRTRFSFVLNHPVEIELESYRGIPPGCPEELARMWFIKEIENAKYEISQNEELNNLLMKLGEDLRTLNISIYTQNSLPDKSEK